MLVLIAKHLLFLNFVYVYKRHICAPKCIAEAKDTKHFHITFNLFQTHCSEREREREHKRAPKRKSKLKLNVMYKYV